MSSMLTRSIAATPEQWKWLLEVMPSDWKLYGDCTYGYSVVQNKDLGIKVTYSYLTKNYNIEVDQ